MAPRDIRLFLPLLLLLVGLLGQQQGVQLSAAQQSTDGGVLLTDGAQSGGGDDDDDDDTFFDANEEFADDWLNHADDDDDNEMFYDGESDEMAFDEEAEENVCATASSHDCQTCCTGQGYDLPYWNKTIGQCFCYLSHGESNICKELVDESNGACGKCCTEHGYKDWDYPGSEGTACYCSNPDYQVFFSSLKFTLKRAN